MTEKTKSKFMAVARNNTAAGLVSAFLMIGGVAAISKNQGPAKPYQPGFAEGVAFAGGIGLIATAIRARTGRRLDL